MSGFPAEKETKGKRLSKVVSRSRSNTLSSTTSSFESPPSSVASAEETTRPMSRGDVVSLYTPGHEQKPSARSFLARGGRMLKRQGSKFNLLTLNEETSDDAARGSSDKDDPFRGRSKSASARGSVMKKPISHPFDFQHVIHTRREDVEKLEKETSQLKSADVESGHRSPPYSPFRPNVFENFSSEELEPTNGPMTGSDDRAQSPANLPGPPRLIRTSTMPAEFGAGFRTSRAIDNFSRPGPRSPQAPISPPGRRSSRNAFAVSDLDRMVSGGADGHRVTSPILPFMPVGNAVTTIDDSARVLKQRPLPPLQTDLGPLLEEGENISPKGTTSYPPASRSSLKYAHSSPSLLNSAEQSPIPQSTGPQASRRISTFDEDPVVPGTPFVVNSRPTTSEGTNRFSIGIFKPVDDESWEDDIDYCYEHAAEADCDFEWTRRSDEFSRDALPSSRGLRLAAGSMAPLEKPVDQALSPTLPELQPRSTRSTSTFSEVLTPAAYSEDRRQQELAIYNPEHEHEHVAGDVGIYDDLIAESHDDKVFNMYQMDRTLPPLSISSRGSRSSISKYNSQESMMLSRAASIVRTHRSSNSAGSLPDLVHSVISSRDGSEITDARQSVIILPHSTSSSKLSLMSTPSNASSTNMVTARSSLKQQTSSDEIEIDSPRGPSSPISEQPEQPVPAFAADRIMPAPRRSSVAPHAGHHTHSMSESVAPRKYIDTAGTPGSANQSFAARMRANSAANSSSRPPPPRRPSTRTSYSLFPNAAVKTPPSTSEMGGFF